MNRHGRKPPFFKLPAGRVICVNRYIKDSFWCRCYLRWRAFLLKASSSVQLQLGVQAAKA
jgi:hypothetical protein